MFDKIINVKISPDDITVYDNEMMKTASEIVLPPGHKFDPDFVYALVRGVSAGEYWGDNNNNDFFEEVELLPNYKSFMDAKMFKNHDNKDVAKAIGSVLSVEWDDYMKAVMILLAVDKTIAPEIARGFIKKTITDVSMGCRVDHIVCSYCGNRAKTKKEYCKCLTDSSMRGKIMPNGKKVYEINKGPRFHDISAVIKGADKTCKAFNVIDGAEAVKNEQLGKVASMDNSILKIATEKKFKPEYKIDPYHDLGFKKVASGKLLKLAEIDKIIQGNIVAISANDKINEVSDSIEDITELLRLFYTEYWDDKTTTEIVDKIKAIAADRRMKPEEALRHFLVTAELAGIEITPLEFASIYDKLGEDRSGFDLFSLAKNLGDTLSPSKYKDILSMSRGESAPGFSGFISPSKRAIIKKIRIDGNPVSMAKQLEGLMEHRSVFPKHDTDMEKAMYENIFKPFMESRSIKNNYLQPRIIKIIKMDMKPRLDNVAHFSLPLSMKSANPNLMDIINMMLNYSSYQNDRVNLVSDGEFDPLSEDMPWDLLSMFKSAAANPAAMPWPKRWKYWGSMLPLMYGYSAYQRSRMKDGKRVSSFNRYIAENPQNAYFVSALLGPMAYKRWNIGKGKALTAKHGFQEAAGKAGNSMKNSFDDISLKIKNTIDKEAMDLDFNKIAGDGFYEGETDFSVFNNDELNNRLLSSYTPDEIDNIKIATIHYMNGDAEGYYDILKEASLGEDDVNMYLKTAKDLITIKLEKIAEDIINEGEKQDGNIVKDVAADMMFYPRGVGMTSLLPGSIVDGFIFKKISDKLQNDTSKIINQKGGKSNE